jgi:ATP-dependent RNA helicase RhlE
VAIHGTQTQNARTKALAEFKTNKMRILVATDIAARGLDIDQLPHVVNFELPNIEEDYVHRIGRTGRAGRSGEAISLVAPDEEKLLRGIERMTKQKIADGDLLGFDASKVEAERPEVREPQKPRQPRGGSPNGERHGGGRKDKGKDSGKAKAQPGRQQQPRAARPAAPTAAAVPTLPPDRAPDEFRDDEIDNFGNRVDYVSPHQNKQQNRGRRPGAAAAGTGAGAGQGRTPSKGPRSNAGGGGAGQGKRQGSGGQSRNGSGRARPPRDSSTSLNRDELPRQEPAVKSARDKQPVIVHKGSRSDRLPTPEQLDQLQSSRPRGEKPALLTRNRDS